MKINHNTIRSIAKDCTLSLDRNWGASEEDLALLGRSRLDLETRTAVKVGNP